MKKLIYKLGLCAFIITSFSSCLKVVDKEKEALEKEFREREKVEVTQQTVPETEYYFEGETILKEDLKVDADKVYMNSNAHVYTGPYQLQINTKKLIVKTGAKIQSFPEGEEAGFNQKGLDGGLVQIKSELATGEIYIHMNGQNSGQGRGGYVFINSGRSIGSVTRPACTPDWGPDGGNGGEAHFDFLDSKDFLIHPQIGSGKPGVLGNVSYTLLVPNFSRAEDMQYYKHPKESSCVRGNSPGKAGFSGKICIKRNDGNQEGCIQ